MTILFAAVIALASAQTASAQRRPGKPFNAVNGRTSPAASPASSPGRRAFAGGGPLAGQTPAAAATTGPAFTGGGRRTPAFGATLRKTRPANGTFSFSSWLRRADDNGDTPPTTPAPPEEAPPYFYTPGALIRTTGQMPVYEKAQAGSHSVDAGEITLNERQAFDVGRAPSLQRGPKDTPPPPTPGATGAAYGGGAAANSAPGFNPAF